MNENPNDVIDLKRIRKLTGNLASLVPDEWFNNRDESSIWLRIYTSLFVQQKVFWEVVSEFLPDQDEGKKFLNPANPVFFAYGKIKGFKVTVINFEMYAKTSGQLCVEVRPEDKELPETNYIFIGTPFCIDGKSGSETEVRDILDTMASVICVHTGLNFMRQCVFEAEVKAKDGSISHPGEPIKIPQITEGPFLAKQGGEDITEISKRISNLRKPKCSRIELALNLLDKAMRKDNGFFEYWTALEVVCNGKTNTIKTRVKDIYQLKSHKEVDVVTGLGVLAEWRGDYIHRGIRPPLTHEIERYLQLLFLDLLRQEIDLPFRGHLAGIQQAQGYDLSPIGLADNRTEGQKRALDEALRGAEKTK